MDKSLDIRWTEPRRRKVHGPYRVHTLCTAPHRGPAGPAAATTAQPGRRTNRHRADGAV